MTDSETPALDSEPSTGGRTDYAGAVYGSLLASSVVVTASAAQELPRLKLALMLIITGVVF